MCKAQGQGAIDTQCVKIVYCGTENMRETVMRKARFLFEIFSMVTACVVIAVAFFTTVLEPVDAVDPVLLWQIPCVSFLCSLGCLIYPWDRVPGKREMAVRIVAHYILINGIVLTAGFCFEWYRVDHLGSVAVMLLTIALIFGIVSALSWRRAAVDAKRMNERLREFQQKKE